MRAHYWLSLALGLGLAAAALAFRGLPLWLDASFAAYLVAGIFAVVGLAAALDGLAKGVWVVAIILTTLGILTHFVGWLDWVGPWVIWPGLGLLAASFISLFVASEETTVAPKEPSAGPHHQRH